MTIKQRRIYDLTIDESFTVKWAVLQRNPDFIMVKSITDNIATVEYYANAEAETAMHTTTIKADYTVFVIEL